MNTFPIGSLVVITGLTSSPEYNQQSGVVQELLPNGRYRVKLIRIGNKELSLRPDNLRWPTYSPDEDEKLRKDAKHRCFQCGAKGKMQVCGMCGVAKYCSRKCQEENWVLHKIGCKVDAKAAKSDDNIKSIKVTASCFHGGMPMQGNESWIGSLTTFIAEQTRLLASIGDIIRTTTELEKRERLVNNITMTFLSTAEKYCVTNKSLFRDHPDACKFAYSMAVDAIGNNDLGMCRAFLRVGIFFELYCKYGDSFISSLHSESITSILQEQADFLELTMSKIGMIQALRKRIPCSCLNTMNGSTLD